MLSKFGVHVSNGPIDFEDLEHMLELGGKHYTLLHYQGIYVPRLREYSPNGIILLRYYDVNYLSKSPKDYARAVAEEAEKYRLWTTHWVYTNEMNLETESGPGYDNPDKVTTWNLDTAEELIHLCPWIVLHAPAFSPTENWTEYVRRLDYHRNLFEYYDVHAYGEYQEMVDTVRQVSVWLPEAKLFVSEFNGIGSVDFIKWMETSPQVEAGTYFIWHWHNPNLPGWDKDLRGSELEYKLRTLMEEPKMSKAMIGNLEVEDLRGELPDQPGMMLPVEFTEKDFIGLHHTATSIFTSPKAIYDYHIALNYGGIGYNFLVNHKGHITYVGECNTSRAGIGANPQANRRGIHIAYIGNTSKEPPTQEALKAIKTLIANIQHAYGWFMPVVPHRLFNSNSKWDTSCPPGWRDWWKEILRAVGE